MPSRRHPRSLRLRLLPSAPRLAPTLSLALAFATLTVPAASETPPPAAVPVATAASESLFDLMEPQERGWWDLDFARALHAAPDLVAARNADGETPLHVAARKAYENEAFLLLRAGADVNARDHRGRTPLHLAAARASEDAWMIRDMLVIKKAELDARDADGFTPLMVAARIGNLRTVELLVWLGASLRAPDAASPSPHALALAGGFNEAAALLADASEGKTVTLKSPLRQIPPHLARSFTDAAAKKDYELLGELMVEGVDINTRDASGATALHRAVYRAHEDVVTFLLMLGADPNLVDGRGNTPFMAASNWFGLSMDWMRTVLLLAGTDAHGPVNKSGFTPLGLAVKSGNEEPAQLLIWCGARPAAPVGGHGTPMRIACEAGSQRLIEFLRRNGINEPEYIDPIPQKRLEQYVKRGLLPQVRELVAGDKVSLATLTASGRTLAVEAVHERNILPQVRELVPAGKASLATLTASGRTLAVEAVHQRNIEMVDLLLELGADPEQLCRDGSNLLHATTSWDFPHINAFRQRLLDRKVKLDVADKHGLTALMKAARHGEDWQGLRQLVAAGADLAARDEKGRTALDLALQSGREGATRYLLSLGAPHSDPATVAEEL